MVIRPAGFLTSVHDLPTLPLSPMRGVNGYSRGSRMDDNAKIQVMLHEYDALKEELRLSQTDATKKVAAVFAFVTVVSSWAFERRLTEVFVVLPFVIVAFALYMLNIMHTFWQFGAYLSELERAINKLAGTDLLRWDSRIWWPERTHAAPSRHGWIRGRLLGGGFKQYEPYALGRPFLLSSGPLMALVLFSLGLSLYEGFGFLLENWPTWGTVFYYAFLGACILMTVRYGAIYGTNSKRRRHVIDTIKSALADAGPGATAPKSGGDHGSPELPRDSSGNPYVEGR